MARFEVLSGSNQLISRALTRVSERSADLRPALDAVADFVADVNKQQFEQQAGSVSGRWDPLSPRYKAWKDKHHPGKPILVLSGRLRRDLTVRPFGIERIDANSLLVGSDAPYADAHQEGRPGRGLPARPVELNRAARTQITRIVQRWVMTGKTS